MNLTNLSVDNAVDILSKLDDVALSQLCQSNSQFSTICQNERIWETVTKRKYGPQIEKIGSWYVTYRNLNRPIYTVKLTGDSEYVTQTFGVFYSYESAAKFLLSNPDYDPFDNIDFTDYGYSSLFHDFIFDFIYHYKPINNSNTTLTFENAINEYNERGNVPYDTSTLKQLKEEFDRFNREYKEIAYDHLKLHPSGDLSNDVKYSITKTTVSP